MKKTSHHKLIRSSVSLAIILMIISIGPTALTDNEKPETFEEDIVKMEGSIIATIYNENLGLISPSINLSKSQILNFNATKTVNDTYYVNRILKIDVEINGNISKELLYNKYLRTLIIIVRQNKKLFPIRDILKRWFIGKPITISKINVTSEENKNIEIPLEFETTEESENVSMFILGIGTPGSIIRRGLPAFTFKKINVELVYHSTDYYNDTTPPVTICEIVGKILE